MTAFGTPHHMPESGGLNELYVRASDGGRPTQREHGRDTLALIALIKSGAAPRPSQSRSNTCRNPARYVLASVAPEHTTSTPMTTMDMKEALIRAVLPGQSLVCAPPGTRTPNPRIKRVRRPAGLAV